MNVRCLLVSLVWFAAAAAAQPASDLLQSGIFAQEVQGDVDGAIRVYRQILSAGAGMRLYAAQAQYRLGLCLLRKKDLAGAKLAFESVIKDYPEERELAARARESMPLGNGLLPAPWGDTEVTEYRWTIPGVPDGWSISRIATSAKSKRTMRIQMNFYGPQLNASMVDVDRETMRPGAATYRGPNAQNSRIAAGVGVYRMAAPDPYPSSFWSMSPTKTSGHTAVYAQAELLYLLRRMPLDPGKGSTIWLLAPGAANFTALKATAAGTESVTVPAGTFECYKVRLSADESAGVPAPLFSSVSIDWLRPAEGETLWYSTTGARPLVRMEFGALRGELTSLRTSEPQGTTSYRDIGTGFSFSLPAGWIYHARTAVAGDGNSVDLIDPESQTVIVISGKSKHTAPEDIAAELQRGAEQRRDKSQHSQTSVRLGGHQALTWIGNRDEHTRRVGYITWVQSEATRLSIAFQTDAAELDGVLKRLQPILDSFRMP